MTTGTSSVSPSRLLDLAEQFTIVVLYGMFCLRLWPAEFTAASWYPMILLVSEGIVVVLVLIRRQTEKISLKPFDWLIAAAGTTLVLAVNKGGTPIAPLLALNLMLAGLAIHVAAKLTLNRSFGLVAANRGLKLNGLYGRVRHPMYAGYFLSHIGYVLFAPTLWNVAIYAVAWSCLIARIYAEERVLGQDPEYATYMSRVRYRLIPGVF